MFRNKRSNAWNDRTLSKIFGYEPRIKTPALEKAFDIVDRQKLLMKNNVVQMNVKWRTKVKAESEMTKKGIR